VAVLDLLASENRPLSEIAAPLKRYSASGEINSRVSDVASILEKLQSEHADAPVVSQLDGLLVRYPDWWFNVRPSNTEPVLRLNVEADNEPLMIEKRDALLARINGN
jgi:phosphomannomutase